MRIGWCCGNGLGFNRVGWLKGIMHFVSEYLVHTHKKGIEATMTNIEDESWQLARTMHKMALMLSVIPKKM